MPAPPVGRPASTPILTSPQANLHCRDVELDYVDRGEGVCYRLLRRARPGVSNPATLKRGSGRDSLCLAGRSWAEVGKQRLRGRERVYLYLW